MLRRDEVEDAESPFLLEALEPFRESPETEGLVRQVATASRRLSRGARRHLRRALVRHLVETGASESEALEAIEAESPFLGEGDEETNLVPEHDESPFAAGEAAGDPGFEYDTPPSLDPATTIDVQAAEPPFSAALRKRLHPVLGAPAAAKAVAFNKAQHPGVSEIPLAELRARIETYIDRPGLEAALGAKVDEATLTAQLAQQFQMKCFRDARFHTGRLDEPTLDALGFVRHRGPKLNAADRTNKDAAKLLRRAVTRALADPLGKDVSARTWFSFMLDAPFLGLTTRWGHGIHLELMRKLRIAQSYLGTIPKYRDLSPVELGDALLWDPVDDPPPHATAWTHPNDPDAKLGDRHRGARPSGDGSSMHLPGLAIDLGYRANPWVGSLSFKEVSGRAATLVGGTITRASGARERAAKDFGELSDAPGIGRKALHTLAQGTLTTGQIYDQLAQWNAWLERYLELGTSDADLQSAITARQADGTPGVMRGTDLPKTVAFWKRQIRTDLQSLRKNSFSADGTPRDPLKGFLSFHRDLVIALRDRACLAWGAVDLGKGERGSGDMMHFDSRLDGIGRAFALAVGSSHVPAVHPCLAPAAAKTQSEVGPLEESEVKPLKQQPAGLKGQLFRLDSKKGGTSKGGTDSAVYVPAAAMKSASLTVILWMHGLSRRNGKFICGNADTAFFHLADTSSFPLLKDLEDSGRPLILVAPSMRWNGDSHTLEKPGEMNAFLKEVEAFLEEVRKWLEANGHGGWTQNAEIKRLILAGHSKAYVVFNGLAARADDPESSSGALAKLTDVWALDTMYGGDGIPALKWAVWAAIKEQTAIRQPKQRAVTFRVLYFRDTGTATEAEWLQRKAKALHLPHVTIHAFDKKAEKKATPAQGGKPAQPAQKAENHCTMTRDYFSKLLATLK